MFTFLYKISGGHVILKSSMTPSKEFDFLVKMRVTQKFFSGETKLLSTL